MPKVITKTQKRFDILPISSVVKGKILGTKTILGLDEKEYNTIYKDGFLASQNDGNACNPTESTRSISLISFSRCPYKPNSKKCRAWNNGYDDYFLSDMKV